MSAGDCRPVHYTGEPAILLQGTSWSWNKARLSTTADRLAFPPANLAILAEKD